ncbi:unnamed protein product [Chrysoparadoxa australica]
MPERYPVYDDPGTPGTCALSPRSPRRPSSSNPYSYFSDSPIRAAGGKGRTGHVLRQLSFTFLPHPFSLINLKYYLLHLPDFPSSPIHNTARDVDVDEDEGPQVQRFTSGEAEEDFELPRPSFGGKRVKYNPNSARFKPPPSIFTPYRVVDAGNCSPRFIRSSIQGVPSFATHMEASRIPLGVLVQPLARVAADEVEVHQVEVGDASEVPPTCTACGAFINNFVRFSPCGEKWVCNLCREYNDRPHAYQEVGINDMGIRQDSLARPELSCSSVDFVIPHHFSLEPYFVLALDVSAKAQSSGLTQGALIAAMSAIKELHRLHGVRARVGILALDAAIHFYYHKGGRAQVAVLTDVSEPAPAIPNGTWMITMDKEGLAQAVEVLEMIKRVAKGASHSSHANCCVSAVKAAANALAATPARGTKVMLFTSSQPSVGIGVIAERANDDLYGTTDEWRLYTPVGLAADADSASYSKLAEYTGVGRLCCESSVSVDVFCNAYMHEYVDMATLALLTKMTAGNSHLFQGSLTESDGLQRMVNSVKALLQTESGRDAELSIRCSTGLQCAGFYSPGLRVAQNAVKLPSVSRDLTIGCLLKHDGLKFTNERVVFIQVVMAYTSSCGVRLARVHNMALPLLLKIKSIYNLIDQDALVTLLLRKYLDSVGKQTIEEVQRIALDDCVQMMATCQAYVPKKEGNDHQLILTESMRLIPLLTSCLLKSKAFRSNSSYRLGIRMAPYPGMDERAITHSNLVGASVQDTVFQLYPQTFLADDLIVYGPECVPASRFALIGASLSIIDTYEVVYLYVGREAPDDLLRELFEEKSKDIRILHQIALTHFINTAPHASLPYNVSTVQMH